jgi:O-acetyl-ADP-ribose deacetylase (regulator of RNase III)
MKITICDLNPAVISAWLGFQDTPDLVNGSIIDLECDAVVSPANSFGWMDGGVDYAYSKHFGWQVQENLQQQLARMPFGELLVGEALIVPTGNARIPYLISAPTMRVPMRITDPADIMLAVRAAVALARKHSFSHIAFPGMGTGCGDVAPWDAARATLAGIRAALAPPAAPAGWREAQQRHFDLEP